MSASLPGTSRLSRVQPANEREGYFSGTLPPEIVIASRNAASDMVGSMVTVDAGWTAR